MVVLLGSFFLLSVAVTFGMVALGAESTPLWVVIMGVFAVLGIVGGFSGLFGLMLFAGWQTWRESRKVEILPPEESGRGAG
jgi:predicted PurR-regulated permease PerM